MDVAICLQRLLGCDWFLLPKVINKRGKSQFKSNPRVTAQETLPCPQTRLIHPCLTFAFVFFHWNPFQDMMAKCKVAQFCELKQMDP